MTVILPGNDTLNRLLISCQETDSSAHLDKRSKHHVTSNSRFDLQSPKRFTVVFKDNTVTCFVYCLRGRVCTRALIG